MHSLRAWAPILLLVFISTESLAQTSTRAPEALAALSACSVSMGALPSNDGYAEGMLRRYFGKDDAEFSDDRVVLKNKRADRVRTEIGSGDAVYVVNQTRGHSIRGGNRGKISSHATAYYRPEHLPVALCTLDLQRTEMTAAYLGSEDVRGRAAFHVLLQSGSEDKARQLLSEFHLFIDQQTGTLLKTRSYVFHPEAIENHSVWEVLYSDFRRAGTALVPYQIERFIDGQRHSTITISTFRTDVAISDSEFE